MSAQLAIADLPESDQAEMEYPGPEAEAVEPAEAAAAAEESQPLTEVAETNDQPTTGEAAEAFPGSDLLAGETAEPNSASEPTEPAELVELRQQVARLQTVVEEMRYSDAEINSQSARVRELADTMRDCESVSKEAKAEFTAAKERYESGVRELRSMIEDRSKGQRRFKLDAGQQVASSSAASAPAAGQSVASQVLAAAAERINAGELNTGELTATAEVGASAEKIAAPSTADEHAASPISVLSSKNMLSQFGQDAWQAAKDREEPFGLGKAELETLEAAEITTIGELEKKMREDAWWHQKLPKFGEKKVAKLIESLRVWRTKFPMPEGVA